MTRTDSMKRPDVEVVTATVVDGMLAAGDVADAPVPRWSFTKTVPAAAALVLVDAGRLRLAFAPVDDQGLVEHRVVEIARGIAGGERE